MDTNVWVYSAGTKHPAITAKAKELVRKGNALAHDFVFGELLLGSGGSARKLIIERYRDLEHISTLSQDEVVSFVSKHGLASKGVGWVDVHLLAAAHAAGVQLWTEEAALKKLAAELDVAFDMGKS